MSRFSLLSSMAIALAGILSSCSSESELLPESERTSTTFHIGLNAQSRAAQSLNLANYDAKCIYMKVETMVTAQSAIRRCANWN